MKVQRIGVKDYEEKLKKGESEEGRWFVLMKVKGIYKIDIAGGVLQRLRLLCSHLMGRFASGTGTLSVTIIEIHSAYAILISSSRGNP